MRLVQKFQNEGKITRNENTDNRTTQVKKPLQFTTLKKDNERHQSMLLNGLPSLQNPYRTQLDPRLSPSVIKMEMDPYNQLVMKVGSAEEQGNLTTAFDDAYDIDNTAHILQEQQDYSDYLQQEIARAATNHVNEKAVQALYDAAAQNEDKGLDYMSNIAADAYKHIYLNALENGEPVDTTGLGDRTQGIRDIYKKEKQPEEQQEKSWWDKPIRFPIIPNVGGAMPIQGYAETTPKRTAIMTAGAAAIPASLVAGAGLADLYGAAMAAVSPGVQATLGLLGDGLQTYFGYEGLKDLTSPEGLQKTYNLVKGGNYNGALLSGMGDALNMLWVRGGTGAVNRAINYGKGVGATRAIANDYLRYLKDYNPEAVAIKGSNPTLNAYKKAANFVGEEAMRRGYVRPLSTGDAVYLATAPLLEILNKK